MKPLDHNSKEDLLKLIREADNYLATGNCIPLSVQEAAQLWRDMERKRKLFDAWGKKEK